MSHRKPYSILSVILPGLLVLTLALLFSCSEQPTTPEKTPGDLTGGGTVDLGAGGSFLLGTVSDSTVAPGRIDVWAMDVAFDDTTGIVSFDVVLKNSSQRNVNPPIHFVIKDIRPDDIAVVDFDGMSEDGYPFYDFSQKLGDDSVLMPGERTERVTMKFHTVTARSFAIGFRLELGTGMGGGAIVGVVFSDDNQNGERDRCGRCEPGIPGITVALMRNSDAGKGVLLARTDSTGEYGFRGLREGVYTVRVVVSADIWKVTSANPLLITLVKGSDGKVQDFRGANFGLYPLVQPPGPPENLFGPIVIGPPTPYGTLLDSTFVNPPSMLPVVYKYYLAVHYPPTFRPTDAVVDSAAAWINDELVFSYKNPFPPDTAYFALQRIELPDSLVKWGENKIRLFTDGDEHAMVVWWVFREP